ncbi:peptide chain release factor 1 [Deltaproteobacteria bacterium TL4]
MLDKLAELKIKYDRLSNLMNQPEVLEDIQQYQKFSKEHSDLGGIVRVYEIYLSTQKDLENNRELLNNPEEDSEIREMAQLEIPVLSEKLKDVEHQIQLLLLPKNPDDARNTILEIRAGTGGDEAALFARDLFRMYAKYAEIQGWKFNIISETPTDIGGFKEIIVSIEGKDVYSQLKFEGGVHRVQRIPKTETQGRVHTSAATVAVMPDVEEIDIEVKPEDVRVDVYRSSGPGGQSVNTTDSAVRLTHLPTGLIVTCQNEKSQLKNKNQAMKVLRARLYDKEFETQHAEATEQRRSMVGSGDRSERIRTYNFPQGRLTDHRINLTLYQLEDILMGNLSVVIEPLHAHHQAELLRGDS